jgi:phenylpropionate dioxygenase-like ring-hydroxylating dioxygenase large terminal subunit
MEENTMSQESQPYTTTSERDLRGDPITGDRYYSREFAQKEWDGLFTRTWQIAGMSAQLPEPGSVFTHEIGNESILFLKDEQGQIKAFYNVCPHRGNRLVPKGQTKVARRLVCAYHSWSYGLDGKVKHVRDVEDYATSPINTVELVPVRVEVLAGMVWFNMDDKAPTLREFLGVVADKLDSYQTDNWTRVLHMTAEVECNWKIIHDNFNEAYHVLSLHRELGTHIEDAYQETGYHIYNTGHALMEMKGHLPSTTQQGKNVQFPLDAMMSNWEMKPEDFAGRAREVRAELQQKKRNLGQERGYVHYEKLTDDQLTDYHHFTIMPNTVLTMSADGFQVLRPQPDPANPERCFFDHWFIMPPVPGQTEVGTPCGMRAFEPAPHEQFKHGEQSIGFVADQDLSVAVAQQKGLHSRGYRDSYLSKQEDRVRNYHEVINDYIEGRR